MVVTFTLQLFLFIVTIAVLRGVKHCHQLEELLKLVKESSVNTFFPGEWKIFHFQNSMVVLLFVMLCFVFFIKRMFCTEHSLFL